MVGIFVRNLSWNHDPLTSVLVNQTQQVNNYINMEHTMNEENLNTKVNIRRLIPVSKFNDYHPDQIPAALRWMIFTNKNDFNQCVVRRGRRALIDEMKYFRWLDEQNS